MLDKEVTLSIVRLQVTEGRIKAMLTASRRPPRGNLSLMLPLRDRSRVDVLDARYWVQPLFVSTSQGYCRFLKEEIRRQRPALPGHSIQQTLGGDDPVSPPRLHT